MRNRHVRRVGSTVGWPVRWSIHRSVACLLLVSARFGLLAQQEATYAVDTALLLEELVDSDLIRNSILELFSPINIVFFFYLHSYFSDTLFNATAAALTVV